MCTGLIAAAGGDDLPTMMCFSCLLRCAGDRNALAGIDIMRKICNHPDLLERTKYEGTEDYGNPERSGKLTVALKVGRRLLQTLLATIARTKSNWRMLLLASRCAAGPSAHHSQLAALVKRCTCGIAQLDAMAR